jgi:hypothetical protein
MSFKFGWEKDGMMAVSHCRQSADHYTGPAAIFEVSDKLFHAPAREGIAGSRSCRRKQYDFFYFLQSA